MHDVQTFWTKSGPRARLFGIRGGPCPLRCCMGRHLSGTNLSAHWGERHFNANVLVARLTVTGLDGRTVEHVLDNIDITGAPRKNKRHECGHPASPVTPPCVEGLASYSGMASPGAARPS